MNPGFRSLWPVGFAMGGVVLGHWLGYVLAVPDAAQRARLLADGGHSRWETMVALAVCAAATSLVLTLSRAFRDGLVSRPAETAGSRSPTLRLAVLQSGLFAVLESFERTFSHGGLSPALFTGRPFLIGLAVQVAVALPIALMVRALARAAAAIGVALRPDESHPQPLVRLLAAQSHVAPVRLQSGAAGVRGPPAG